MLHSKWQQLPSQNLRSTPAKTYSVHFASRASKMLGYFLAFTHSVPVVYSVRACSITLGTHKQSTVPFAWMKVSCPQMEFKDFQETCTFRTSKIFSDHLPHYCPGVIYALIMRLLSATVRFVAVICVNFVSKPINDSGKHLNIH